MTGFEIALLVSAGVNALQALFAKKKSKMLKSVIRGVEAAADNEEVKRSIRQSATAAGVQNSLHKEVKRTTGPYLSRGNRS